MADIFVSYAVEDREFVRKIITTFATWIVRNGGNPALLNWLGGCKSQAMVDRYAKMSTQQVAKTLNIFDNVMPAPKKLKLVVNK